MSGQRRSNDGKEERGSQGGMKEDTMLHRSLVWYMKETQ